MSDNFEENINDNVKNLYIIKKRLSDLKMNRYGYFEYFVGNHWLLKINPLKKFPTPAPIVTLHDKMNVFLYELSKDVNHTSTFNETFVNLDQDSRFKNYKPIQYSEFEWKNDGKEMPILQLCELVKYLHRLSNLTVFI